jgi:hexosaminidase
MMPEKAFLGFSRLRKCLAIVSGLAVLSIPAPGAGPPDLMPLPEYVKYGSGRFRLNQSFTICVRGTVSPRLFSAANRTLRRLGARSGLFFRQGMINAATSASDRGLVLTCRRPGILKLGEDESYRLSVNPSRILLKAKTDIGIVRGCETLIQLLQGDREGYYFPSVDIKDSPRFAWRGLLIDSCRHFLPPEVIKRNLDGMAAVKLNVLHWHLTEDQGFRLECKTFPKLHNLGSDGLFYTHEEVREVVAYAADRGIRVMPEFDIPGHSTAWFVGHPELASAPGPYQIERKFGIFDPCFNPASEEVYRFFDRFFAEMAALFPDPYIHIGGDEVNGRHWDANPAIQAFMKEHGIADNHALQAHFNRRILAILTKYGKKMAGWEEIAQPGFPGDILAQSWRDEKSLVASVRRGYRVILSRGYYIDLCQSAAFHYLNDPSPDSLELTKRQRKRILGGEATMWGELISPETVDSRIWPRTAAIAERFWSPKRIRDTADMYRRLERVSLILEWCGLTHRKNREMMMRRLTNGEDPHALASLVGAIAPLKDYRRHESPVGYTQFSPLTRVVDAAVPDPADALRFNRSVDRYLESADPEELKQLRAWLSRWRSNHETLLPVIHSSPILAEIESLSADLSRVAAIALHCLEVRAGGASPAAGWRETALKTLEKAKQPRGDCELAITSGVEKMLKSLDSNRP